MCGRLCTEVAVLGLAKNAPDKPGRQTGDLYIQPGQRVAGLMYDSNTHKFILAKKKKKDKIKEEKDLVPDVSDVYKSKEFKALKDKSERDEALQVDCSDIECSLDPEEAQFACAQLCIDN